MKSAGSDCYNFCIFQVDLMFLNTTWRHETFSLSVNKHNHLLVMSIQSFFTECIAFKWYMNILLYSCMHTKLFRFVVQTCAGPGWLNELDRWI